MAPAQNEPASARRLLTAFPACSPTSACAPPVVSCTRATRYSQPPRTPARDRGADHQPELPRPRAPRLSRHASALFFGIRTGVGQLSSVPCGPDTLSMLAFGIADSALPLARATPARRAWSCEHLDIRHKNFEGGGPFGRLDHRFPKKGLTCMCLFLLT